MTDKTSPQKNESKELLHHKRSHHPIDDIEGWFEESFPRRWMHPFRREWPGWSELAPFEGKTPRADIIERDNEIIVKAELPGVKKDDLEISLTDDTVTITAVTSHEHEEEKGDYYRHEISHGEFKRTLGLPSDVNGDKAKASFRDGLLELKIPKRESAHRHTVKVD